MKELIKLTEIANKQINTNSMSRSKAWREVMAREMIVKYFIDTIYPSIDSRYKGWTEAARHFNKTHGAMINNYRAATDHIETESLYRDRYNEIVAAYQSAN